MRVLRYALEEHMGPVKDDHPILRWLPTAAADAISRYRLGRDGLTAEQRRTGRPWRKMIAEFGERVHFREAQARATPSGMQPKLFTGYYIGHHARTGSLLIMTTNGVVKATGFDVCLRRIAGVDRIGIPLRVSLGTLRARLRPGRLRRCRLVSSRCRLRRADGTSLGRTSGATG